MNTPIIKISDDQNEITHESGVVTVFINNNSKFDTCNLCAYINDDGNCMNKDLPCEGGYYTIKP